MNREILFRGKAPITEEWIYGDLITLERGFGIRKKDDSVISCNRVDIETIGQYTGLKDKNGNKIFERDILRFEVPDGTIRHFVMEWASEDRILRPLFNFVPDGNPIRINGWCFNWNGYRLYPSVIDEVPDNEVMEIVGNIHDNPELMK